VFPYSSVEEVQASTGWKLRVSDTVGTVEAPSAKELAALRNVDTTGALR
jgi:glutaconate CoA-transferase subunit B